MPADHPDRRRQSAAGFVIAGGGPAAMAAARAYRASGGDGEVVLVAAEGRMPYRRPPLTKELLEGSVGESELPLEDEIWPAAHGVSFVAGRALALDPAARTLALAGGRQLRYRTCLLATGARATRLPIPGADDPGVLTLRTVDDVRNILGRLQDGGDVIVIGSGFIGCEIAASLRRRGHHVSLVSDEPEPQVARLGPEVGRRLRDWLADDGVALRLGASVDRIHRDGHTLRVEAAGAALSGRLVIMAGGAAPRTELAVDAGLALDGGAIATDEHQHTSADGVLAAGDACRARHALAGRALHVEHWGDALAQGTVAGCTAAGEHSSWMEVPGFWSTIGGRTLKYAAWGDGHDRAEFDTGAGGAFAVRYYSAEALVGVLAHDRDDEYDRCRAVIAADARAVA